MMNKHPLVLAAAMLVLLAGPISTAKSGVQSGSAEKTLSEEPITLEIAGGTSYGTLVRPQSRSPQPVVLIIAGSGPTDRDGNSPVFKGPNNSLKLLAHGLAAHGIASVRYDKRGIGETGKAMQLAAEKAKIVLREEDLSFESYIDDAVRWGKHLQTDRRFSSLTVIGHSEGSLIGMVAAQRIAADAFVSIAGGGRPVQQIILEQVRPSFTPELLKTTEHILQELGGGRRVESVPQELHMLFRPSVQPYMISWLRYDPAKEIAKLRSRVLIVQGTTDLQVRSDDANALGRGNPKARVLLIEGMNHVLKMVPNEPAKQVASYSDPTLPVAPDLVSAVVGFVKENSKR
ncbi:MAG TPA: alpha/beta fold hydrolase [Pyrinomonadaceae bacterium]|nr:alpha/beta fold hydrolase [Pyrinomonadaceae bacterium]